MVRLEIPSDETLGYPVYIFTFQYGQIRNSRDFHFCCSILTIYIPVWLDQKSTKHHSLIKKLWNLHSSMVRLEIKKAQIKIARGGIIYIPVWLDQKLILFFFNIIIFASFTFQYGQIRNE